MFVFRSVNRVVRKAFALGLVGLLATASFAQEAAKTGAPVPPSTALTPMPQAPAPQHNAHLYSDQDYTRGQSQFPKFWSVWTVRGAAPPNFTNSPLIDRVIRDGKMYLSLDDAVALALENNLDIAIQRYNLMTADVDILRTSSGARNAQSGLASSPLLTLSHSTTTVPEKAEASAGRRTTTRVR